jgi:cytochrome c oxidase subunit 2
MPPFPYLPPDLSTHGGALDALLWWVHILMAVLFFGWGAFFLYTMWRFTKNRNPRADYAGVQSHTSSYLEIGVAVVEVILLFGLSVPLWAKWIDTGKPLEGDGAVEVHVIAQQFAWNVHYPGVDGKFGRLKPNLIDETLNAIGLDPEDPSSADDIALVAQLIVPKDRPVRVRVTSKDVIHSFFIPVMRVKQDAIPGESIPVGFQATQTSMEFKRAEAEGNPAKYQRLKREKALANLQAANPQATMAEVEADFDANPQKYGDLAKQVPDFEIACAQLCGAQHYKMVGQFHIVDGDEFDNLRSADDFIAFTSRHLAWKSSD